MFKCHTSLPTCENCEIRDPFVTRLLTFSQNARGCAYKPGVGDRARSGVTLIAFAVPEKSCESVKIGTSQGSDDRDASRNGSTAIDLPYDQ